jgi:hypothetical protein
MSEGERPPLVNNQGAQTGEQSYGNVAGRDVTHYGIPAAILDDVREVQLRLVDVIERMGHDFRAELRDTAQALSGRVDRAKDEIKLHEIAERQRRVRDDAEREQRRLELDAELAAIRAEQVRARHVQLVTRRIVVGAIAALALAFMVLGWLTVDRLAALALLRLWAGGGAALAFQLWKDR